jgi:hypothetical protein
MNLGLDLKKAAKRIVQMAAERKAPVVLHYYMRLYWGDPLDRLDEDMQAALRFVGEAQRDSKRYLVVHPSDTVATVLLRWERSGGGSGSRGGGGERESRSGGMTHVYKVEQIPTFAQVGIQVAESGLQASRKMAKRTGLPRVLLHARRV